MSVKKPVLSDLAKGLIESELNTKSTRKGRVAVDFADMVKQEDENTTLAKSFTNMLNGGKGTVERLAFESDPSQNSTYASLYHQKQKLIPDPILKRIAIQDDLVAAIIGGRSNQFTPFGRPREDRHDYGFVIEPKKGVIENMSQEQKDDLKKRIDVAVAKLATCGETTGWADRDQLTLSQWFYQSVRSALVVGRLATEIIWVRDASGEKKFHSFRPIDAGTIYRAAAQKTSAQALREQAKRLIEGIKSKKLEPERFANDEYSFIQVIDGTPLQAFTDEECLVYNFYPIPDVELDGYPLTPLDTVISAVSTHINITTHNKLYFQSGRAARGILVIQDDDADQQVVAKVRQQFNASINNVNNSWRMPVFAVGADSNVSWQAIDSGSRDMEFQYLSDMNARTILSAFQMSPDELPGYTYLSRGTNSQALSECLSLDSRILVKGIGLISIGDFLGGEQEKQAEIWDGSSWTYGRVFIAGHKKLMETEVACGIKLQTSPDHRFRSIDSDGNPVWKHQEELSAGDWVLVNKNIIPGDKNLIPSFKGNQLTPEIMEILGWIAGDGCIVPPGKRTGAQIVLCYHPTIEQDIWGQHYKTLEEWGLKTSHIYRELSEEQIEKKKSRPGIKSACGIEIRNIIYNIDFERWLESLGFKPSCDGKVIPDFVHVLPIEYRRAFLRGLFSADGGKIGPSGAIGLTCQNDKLREQTRQLLLGLGIRTLKCKGLLRESFGKKSFSKKLFIKDKNEFWKTIGFVQPHKQFSGENKWTINDCPISVTRALLSLCKESPLFHSMEKHKRDNVNSALKLDGKNPGKRKFSTSFVKEIARLCQVKLPYWFENSYLEQVVATRDLSESVVMADIEMFSNTHEFIAEGFVVHNSNSEFKLEAHRDLGIRPLIRCFEDFLSQRILPLLDRALSAICHIKLLGLEADTEEKETTLIQQWMPVHGTYNEVLEKVEKKPVEKQMGGDFPINPAYQAILDKYVPVGAILEYYFDMKGASKDPKYAYVRDPFYFQNIQLQMQMQQMQAQAQQQQAQQGGGGGGGGGGGQPQGGSDGGGQQQESNGPDTSGGFQHQDEKTEKEKSAEVSKSAGQDLTRAIDQAIGVLGKAEASFGPAQKAVLATHSKLVDSFLEGFKKDRLEAMKAIMESVPKGI